RFYQIRGIRPEELYQLPNWQAENISAKAQKDSDYSKEDLERVRFIQNLMDYRLSEVSADTDVPSGAIRVAELLGMDEKLITKMKSIWKKDQIINGKP
ncbi:MAG TPA: hypothetical protein PLW19_05670, partial [Anaerolineaceae bacterium]|nr:hypothetical protein [Anaerolineaceae bacterium]